MIVEIFSWLVVVAILFATTLMVLQRDWRMQLAALAFQYLCAFWLVTHHLPLAMAAAKLVSGWMVVAALGITRLSISDPPEQPSEKFSARRQSFPIILMAIVALVAAGATPRLESATPGLGLQVIAAGILLIGAGLIHLSLTADVLRVTLGLLTMLSGFEIIYAAVESSILVAGLLAITNLGLALVGSYLLLAEASTSMREQELS